MELTYDRLSADELTGTELADYLVALDATFRLVDDGVILLEEPGFPVVELARALIAWAQRAMRSDFQFDSMSYEEVGTLSIRRSQSGWVASSALEPGVATRPMQEGEVGSAVLVFTARVREDLEALGLDPARILL